MASATVAPTETTSGSPVAGSAEFLSRHLKPPGHACGHFPKYRIMTNQAHHDYPSRLGFFYDSKTEPVVVYLDTWKLCKDCLDLVVPKGYNYWSILSAHNTVDKGKPSSATNHESGYAERKPKLLDTPSSASQYPQFVQARAEQLPRNDSTVRAGVNHNPAVPITLSIPQLAGTSKAWQWLSSQRKPFYIDQLHMIKGWTSLAEATAARDFLIVEKTGVPFIPTPQRDRVKTSKLVREATKEPTPMDVGVASAGFNDETPKASQKIKTSRKKSASSSRASVPTPTTVLGHQTESNTTGDLPRSLSMFLGKQELPTSQIPNQKRGSSLKSAKTDTPAPEPLRASSERTQGAGRPANVTGKSQKREPRKAEHEHTTKRVFSHTSNYNRYEPLPFDSPVKPASLDNYKRGVEVFVTTQDIPSRLPLEEVLGEYYSPAKRSKVRLRGPGSDVEEEDMLALVGSRGLRKQAVPETNLGFIKAVVKAKPKVSAASGKANRSYSPHDRPQKAKRTKSGAVPTDEPRDKSAPKGPATSKADRQPPSQQDKPHKAGAPKSNVDSVVPSRKKSTQKIPADLKKAHGPSSQQDKTQKADEPKPKVVSPNVPHDKSTQKAPATTKTNKTSLRQNESREAVRSKSKVASSDSSRKEQNQNVPVTSKTDKSSSQPDKSREVHKPKPKAVPPDQPRDRSGGNSPATSRTDKPSRTRDKPSKVGTRKSGAAPEQSDRDKSAQKTQETGNKPGKSSSKQRASEKTHKDDRASKKPPEKKRSDPSTPARPRPVSKQIPRPKVERGRDRREGNKNRSGTPSVDGRSVSPTTTHPAPLSDPGDISGGGEPDASMPSSDEEGNPSVNQNKDVWPDDEVYGDPNGYDESMAELLDEYDWQSNYSEGHPESHGDVSEQDDPGEKDDPGEESDTSEEDDSGVKSGSDEEEGSSEEKGSGEDYSDMEADLGGDDNPGEEDDPGVETDSDENESPSEGGVSGEDDSDAEVGFKDEEEEEAEEEEEEEEEGEEEDEDGREDVFGKDNWGDRDDSGDEVYISDNSDNATPGDEDDFSDGDGLDNDDALYDNDSPDDESSTEEDEYGSDEDDDSEVDDDLQDDGRDDWEGDGGDVRTESDTDSHSTEEPQDQEWGWDDAEDRDSESD